MVYLDIEGIKERLSSIYASRDIERIFFRCPEVDSQDIDRYPGVDRDDFESMYCGFIEDTTVSSIYAFVNKNKSGGRFVDIYIWDIMLYPQFYQRFVISEGLCLATEDEKKLLEYLYSGQIRMPYDNLKRLQKDINIYFPQWHLDENLCEWSLNLAFQHIYFTSFRSGPREILFKAGLWKIALYLDLMTEINFLGTTPCSIIGHGIPMRLLRIMNDCWFMIDKLEDDGKLEKCIAIYKMYGQYIDKTPTWGQYQYLEDLYENGGQFGNHSFIRLLYNRFDTDEDPHIRDYKRFLILRDEMAEFKHFKLPKIDEVEEVVENLEEYSIVLKKTDDLDGIIHQINIISNLNYIGEKYEIILPDSARDFLNEAFGQHNCVINYLENHIRDNDSKIIFLRERENPQRPFVTMEVKEGRIEQALGKFDEDPSEEVINFIKEYAITKELSVKRYIVRQTLPPEPKWLGIQPPQSTDRNYISYTELN